MIVALSLDPFIQDRHMHGIAPLDRWFVLTRRPLRACLALVRLQCSKTLWEWANFKPVKEMGPFL